VKLGNIWSGLTPADVAHLRGLRAEGKTAAEIARRMDLSLRTVWRYLAPDRYACAHCGLTFAVSSEAIEHSLIIGPAPCPHSRKTA
jgi:predicted DNA-binding protein (UPF0251 family)